MLLLRKCCFCITLKSGTLLIASLALIFSLLDFVMFSSIMSAGECRNSKIEVLIEHMGIPEDLREWCRPATVVGMVGSVIILSVSAMLLYGIKKERPSWMSPYLVIKGFSLILSTVVVFVAFFMSQVSSGSALVIGTVMVLAILFHFYIFWVVLSYYKVLRKQGKKRQNARDSLTNPNFSFIRKETEAKTDLETRRILIEE